MQEEIEDLVNNRGRWLGCRDALITDNSGQIEFYEGIFGNKLKKEISRLGHIYCAIPVRYNGKGSILGNWSSIPIIYRDAKRIQREIEDLVNNRGRWAGWRDIIIAGNDGQIEFYKKIFGEERLRKRFLSKFYNVIPRRYRGKGNILENWSYIRFRYPDARRLMDEIEDLVNDRGRWQGRRDIIIADNAGQIRFYKEVFGEIRNMDLKWLYLAIPKRYKGEGHILEGWGDIRGKAAGTIKSPGSKALDELSEGPKVDKRPVPSHMKSIEIAVGTSYRGILGKKDVPIVYEGLSETDIEDLQSKVRDGTLPDDLKALVEKMEIESARKIAEWTMANGVDVELTLPDGSVRKLKILSGDIDYMIGNGISLDEFLTFLREALAMDNNMNGTEFSSLKDGAIISLLDTSRHLGENCRKDGFIGINKAVFELPVYQRNITLQLVFAHEMRHEVGAVIVEDEQVPKDKGLFKVLITVGKIKEILSQFGVFIDGADIREILVGIDDKEKDFGEIVRKVLINLSKCIPPEYIFHLARELSGPINDFIGENGSKDGAGILIRLLDIAADVMPEMDTMDPNVLKDERMRLGLYRELLSNKNSRDLDLTNLDLEKGIFKLFSLDFPKAVVKSDDRRDVRYLADVDRVRKDLKVVINNFPKNARSRLEDSRKAVIVRDINDFIDLNSVEVKDKRVYFRHLPGIKAILDLVKNSNDIYFVFMVRPEKKILAEKILSLTGILGKNVFLYEYKGEDIIEEAKANIGMERGIWGDQPVDNSRIVYFVKEGYKSNRAVLERISTGNLKIVQITGASSSFHVELLFGIIYARVGRIFENIHGRLTQEGEELISALTRLGMSKDEVDSLRQDLLNGDLVLRIRLIRISEILEEFKNCQLYVYTSA